MRARLFLHLEPRLQVEEQSLLVLRRRLLLWRLDLLPIQLLCPVRLADSSVRKGSPAPVDVVVARPVVGPAKRVRNALGNAPLTLVALLVAGRSSIALLRALLKKSEPSLLPPPPPTHPAGRVPGGTPGDSRPAPAGDRSPRPGPSDWRLRSSAAAERYRTGFGGHLSSPPLGEADDDSSSALDSLDIDRDMTFRSVLALIRNFHSMEEPASVPSARCKTSLASIYGLMSETSPAFHLPTSPLLRSLLDDTNLALSKFFEDQTVHGFLPVPSRRHRRYYRTSSSSFPGLYSVPPGVTSITLEKASEVKKRSVSLSASQVSSMETMLSGVCEVASWLDWWLSTCGGFRENLPIEVRADFERLILSGSRALEFLASQGTTALSNLVLSRRDSLLADVRSTVPAEEVARLRYSPLPETVSIFPSSLLDSALNKMRAAANDALVQRALHPPRIPRKPAAGGGSPGSLSAGSAQASSSGASRPAQKQSSTSSPSGQSGKKGRTARVRLPFPCPLEAPATPGVKEKVPERSQPDGMSLPLRVGACLAPHWRRWQAIGAESWVETVLRDGYRVPFTDSPPPLSRTPVSFPMYRAGSPRAQALRQEVKAMLAKGALEIALDPGPGFYSRLFLVEKASGVL